VTARRRPGARKSRLRAVRLPDNGDDQTLVHDLVAGPGWMGAPYPALLHNPAITRGMLGFCTAVRYESSLPPLPAELVCCLVGQVNGAGYEVPLGTPEAYEVGQPDELFLTGTL
jgi:hypothetical protein